MNYCNEWAKENKTDPHEELQQFVINNRTHINHDEIKFALPNLRAGSEDDRLKEFIKTRNPYEVLQTCFYDLYEVHKKVYPKDPLSLFPEKPDDSEIINSFLDKFGFRKEVKPVGFSQLREEIKQHLDSKEPRQIDGAMQKLLRKIFLFYHYTLFNYVVKNNVEVTDYNNFVTDLRKLSSRYDHRGEAIGRYFEQMRDFMGLIERNDSLSKYCQSNFGREMPLNKNQIAELGMFTLYRNILSHPKPSLNKWNESVHKANSNFKNMDDSTRNAWKGNWEYVVRVYKSNQNFPPEEQMIQRMIAFFEHFLDSISENEIYPKVIVLRSRTVDEYGIHTVAADTDTGETIFFTDYSHNDFQNNTFTEYYYHSCTNPTGIEPSLVRKDELEKWATGSDDNAEN